MLLTVKIPTEIRQSNQDITIVDINDIIAFMNGLEFYCNEISSETEVFSAYSENLISSDAITESSNDNARTETDASVHVPSENRTLYINCSSNVVECTEIFCTMGPFVSSLSVARFIATLELQLANFPGKY